MLYPWPLDGGIIGISFAGFEIVSVAPCPKSTIPNVYPLPPETTVVLVIVPDVLTSMFTFAPDPSPLIS